MNPEWWTSGIFHVPGSKWVMDELQPPQMRCSSCAEGAKFQLRSFGRHEVVAYYCKSHAGDFVVMETMAR